MISKVTDQYWMKRALVLARRGMGSVHPNPMVGAIVLNAQGQKVGQGFHPAYGQAHAEALALKQASGQAKSGTLYVTLEPCFHEGKTPPCVDAVLTSNVARVVVAMQDPNVKVQGQSIALLRKQGVQVSVGCMESIANALNEPFVFSLSHSRPFIDCKVAVSRDGYMGHRHQRVLLSGPMLQHSTMKLRAQAQGILVGKGTWQNDDPWLNIRGRYQQRRPTAILLDPTLEIQPTQHVLQTGNQVWIIHDEQHTPANWLCAVPQVTCVAMPWTHQGVSPQLLLQKLYKQGMGHILLEGGSKLIASFAREGLIDRWTVYQSSTHLAEKYPSQNLVQLQLADFPLHAKSAIRVGTDVVIHARTWQKPKTIG